MRRLRPGLLGSGGHPGFGSENWVISGDHLGEDDGPEQGEDADREDDRTSPQLAIAPAPRPQAEPRRPSPVVVVHGPIMRSRPKNNLSGS